MPTAEGGSNPQACNAVRGQVEAAAIAACEAWAAEVTAERDRAIDGRTKWFMQACGVAISLGKANAGRDEAQRLLAWWAKQIAHLANSHLCDIDSQSNCVCQDLQREAATYTGDQDE